MTNSSVLIRESVALLRAHMPFDAFPEAELEAWVQASELIYLAPQETLLSPQDGPSAWCWIIREGSLVQTDSAQVVVSTWGPGDTLPVGALLAGRPVSWPIRAQGDVFCWRLSAATFHEFVARVEPFRRFCQGRLASLSQATQQALREDLSRRVAQDRLLEQPVRDLVRRAPVQMPADAPIREVFERMEAEQVGSIILGAGEGIFTRQDVIGRVVLSQVSLDTPIRNMMSSPLITIEASAPVAEAVLTMAAHAVRHLAVLEGQTLIGVVTERDLFSLQRQSIGLLSSEIKRAQTVPELARSARGIREWTALLVAQGATPSFLTRLISRLNDQLTRRILDLRAQDHAMPLSTACWMALGSEGREEQTIATDQDNALILPPGAGQGMRARWLDFARSVNEDLAACGFPLCKGGIMASNPAWCLEWPEWQERFAAWIEQGAPAALLNASIFFDLRGLAGDLSLAQSLRAQVGLLARKTPRFLKQMSDNALRNGPPAGLAASAWAAWLPSSLDQTLDLKLHGTMPLVDAARLLALAEGITATGTIARLQSLADAGRIQDREKTDWTDAFEFFQTLRLRAQHRDLHGAAGLPPNSLRMHDLSQVEQRALRESWRQMRRLQQRLALDFPG